MEQKPSHSGFGVLEEIFHAALDFSDPEQRKTYLNTVCAGDTLLLRQIEDLLDACDEANDHQHFLADNSSRFLVERPGLRIGRYVLTEQIGSGGCGVVWKAEQQKPLRRDVALKIIKAGMDTRMALARFNTERQALALMDHPYIAKVFDAGTTVTGRPYFVMELVAGIKITDFCAQKRLGIPERLALFIKVCRAFQHAHAKGIVHRDIKPSNVLVTLHDGAASPKIIDFGIAKATDQFPLETPVLTASGQFMGTPAYMSPEQVGGKNRDIDARSDVYSLGVLLYELVTGQPPISAERFESLPLDQILRFIRETEPPRPSDLVAMLSPQERMLLAADCGTRPNNLARRLRNELDWIVMMCLEKDRKRRYQTANDLAEDLERHLNSKALLYARPPYLIRGARVWLSRRKVPATIFCLVIVALALALVTFRTTNKSPRWEPVVVAVKGRDAPVAYNWSDIVWFEGQGWLVGNIDENGGGRSPHVGHGVMLHKSEADQTWDSIKIENFASGVGTNRHFNNEIWTEVGPITGIHIAQTLLADGKTRQTNGWICSVTGIYSTTNSSDLNARWSRITPPPDGPDCFGRFSAMIGLENFTEIYAVGWQGISHWDGVNWQVQKKTRGYLINNIIEAGGEMWAVGGLPEDEYGWQASNSHGAIYHLAPGSTNWDTANLPGIQFAAGQRINDITFEPRYAVLFAVGDKGMMIRCSLEGNHRVWKQIPFGRENDLKSVACDVHADLWAVGSDGLIIQSKDHGSTWKKLVCRDETGAPITQNLNRIRFTPQGWILGQHALLRLIQP